MRLILTLLSLLLYTTLYAQDTYYYDVHWQRVNERDQWTYRRVVEEESDSIYVVNEYYNTGSMYSTGRYLNCPKAKYMKDFRATVFRTGTFTYYYRNGKKMKEGNYTLGIKDGVWERYFEDGSLWERYTKVMGRLYDGTLYHENGKRKETLRVVLIDGELTTIHSKYNKFGERTNKTRTKADTTVKTLYKDVLGAGYMASYTSPNPAYNVDAFIERILKYPRKARVSGQRGDVFISFLVDKQGYITDIEPTYYHSSTLLKLCSIDAIQKMPPWKPGKRDGKPVEVKITVPMRFYSYYYDHMWTY